MVVEVTNETGSNNFIGNITLGRNSSSQRKICSSCSLQEAQVRFLELCFQETFLKDSNFTFENLKID